jgi:hypothetical protein
MKDEHIIQSINLQTQWLTKESRWMGGFKINSLQKKIKLDGRIQDQCRSRTLNVQQLKTEKK